VDGAQIDDMIVVIDDGRVHDVLVITS